MLGYMGKLLRVDLTRQKITEEPTDVERCACMSR